MQISSGMMPMGIQAIQNGQQQMAKAAQAVASSTANSNADQAPDFNIADLTQQLVQMDQAKHLTMAGAKMVQTADEALGTIINTMA